MLIDKVELINDLARAIKDNRGFAIGKLGFSEQCVAGYPLFLRSNPSTTQLMAYESVLRYHCERQIGIFPTDKNFLLKFSMEFQKHIHQLDIIGLFGAPQERKLIEELNIHSKLINYRYTEPDQSIPEDPTLCYLPLFKNKKILLVAPFAEFLKRRADAEVFENVWSKIKKKWFLPAEVSAIEFPYSYITETHTHQLFENSIQLYNSICDKINEQDFDIALIAAGALGIPIAAHIKSMGRVAISLGGHLQVIFGVAGQRWKRDEYYQQNFINDFWVDMPLTYHPKNKEFVSDAGAYW